MGPAPPPPRASGLSRPSGPSVGVWLQWSGRPAGPSQPVALNAQPLRPAAMPRRVGLSQVQLPRGWRARAERGRGRHCLGGPGSGLLPRKFLSHGRAARLRCPAHTDPRLTHRNLGTRGSGVPRHSSGPAASIPAGLRDAPGPLCLLGGRVRPHPTSLPWALLSQPSSPCSGGAGRLPSLNSSPTSLLLLTRRLTACPPLRPSAGTVFFNNSDHGENRK